MTQSILKCTPAPHLTAHLDPLMSCNTNMSPELSHFLPTHLWPTVLKCRAALCELHHTASSICLNNFPQHWVIPLVLQNTHITQSTSMLRCSFIKPLNVDWLCRFYIKPIWSYHSHNNPLTPPLVDQISPITAPSQTYPTSHNGLDLSFLTFPTECLCFQIKPKDLAVQLRPMTDPF